MKRQFPDEAWDLGDDQGHIGTWEKVGIAVLMDIRRELRRLNQVLACPNFMGIPGTLKHIQRNTTKRRRRAK